MADKRDKRRNIFYTARLLLYAIRRVIVIPKQRIHAVNHRLVYVSGKSLSDCRGVAVS